MEKDFRPVFTFGLVIFMLSILNFMLEYKLVYDLGNEYVTVFTRFALVVGVVHLFVGLAVILRVKWGLWALKALLYVYYLGFPFGTMFSRWMLGYIKKNNIARYFK